MSFSAQNAAIDSHFTLRKYQSSVRLVFAASLVAFLPLFSPLSHPHHLLCSVLVHRRINLGIGGSLCFNCYSTYLKDHLPSLLQDFTQMSLFTKPYTYCPLKIAALFLASGHSYSPSLLTCSTSFVTHHLQTQYLIYLLCWYLLSVSPLVGCKPTRVRIFVSLFIDIDSVSASVWHI